MKNDLIEVGKFIEIAHILIESGNFPKKTYDMLKRRVMELRKTLGK